MEDNADGEPLENVENTLGKSIPNGETDNLNANQESKNMEVHHHPNLHHKPKKWKEYFLEFLMIFLAVTLGFFAENLRESIKEKRQIHEYMQSMIGDLQDDIAMYDSSIIFNNNHCDMIDTINESISQMKKNTTKVYFLARQLTMGSSIISPDDKTFEQLKSSGSLRLINKQIISDSIAAYYQWLKKFDYWSNLQRQRINDIIEVNDKLFDASVFFSVLKKIENKNQSTTTDSSDNPVYITSAQATINIIVMRNQYYYGILKLMNERIMKASAQANGLINLLKKEYHLE